MTLAELVRLREVLDYEPIQFGEGVDSVMNRAMWVGAMKGVYYTCELYDIPIGQVLEKINAYTFLESLALTLVFSGDTQRLE